VVIRVNQRQRSSCFAFLRLAVDGEFSDGILKKMGAWPKKLFAATARVLFFLFASHNNPAGGHTSWA
jgi:hypothetical protein